MTIHVLLVRRETNTKPPVRPRHPKSSIDEVANDVKKKSIEVPKKDNGFQDPAKEGRERAQRNELECMFGQEKDANDNRMSTPISVAGSTYVYLGGSIPVNVVTLPNVGLLTDLLMPDLEDTANLQDSRIFSCAYDNEVDSRETDFNNLELTTVDRSNQVIFCLCIIYGVHCVAFLYGTIEEEVYVCQPHGFEDPHFLNKVYKVEKALYGHHQAPRAWYETLYTYLLENGFRRGIIDKTVFIKKDKDDILLVQVYVDDIIFGSNKKSLCTEFERLMHKKFQMSSIGELTFFLRLQVMQKDDGIFISQDKYVADILKIFNFLIVKTASTPIETNKALLKHEEARDVNVHLYKSIIGLLMYLTSSRPDIMFAVCAYRKKIIVMKHLLDVIFNYKMLKKAKTAQAKEIANLKKRVKKLERKKKSRTSGLKRLWKVGSTTRVESYKDKESLGDQEDASKQGRMIDNIDQDEEITLVDETQGRLNEEEMFGVNDLDGDEVIMDATTGEEVEQSTKVAKKEVSTVDLVTTVGEVVTTAATTPQISKDELTLAYTLIEIKAAKPKARGVIVQEPTQKLQNKEQEQLTEAEKARLFMEFLDKRRKFFARKREIEKKNRPPTKAQQRNLMYIYLKNIDGWKLKNLKKKSFDEIQKLFDSVMKRVNIFVDMNTEIVENRPSFSRIILPCGTSSQIKMQNHSALRYLFTNQDAKPWLIQWIMLLQEFDIEIHDKKGAKNLAADHLSRLENPDLGKLTNAEIRELFPKEWLMKISNKNNESWLFPGKLKSRWYEPFSVCKNMKNGAIELHDEDRNGFIINKQRVKTYPKRVLEANKDDDITMDDEGEVT
nr:uncharacterized mitochondrial protein AtMg00810-like [Tanacetum cinerariifolium]